MVVIGSPIVTFIRSFGNGTCSDGIEVIKAS
jgi:hypothetical protein